MIRYRGKPWQWHVFRPLRGQDYRAFWFGPFKFVLYDRKWGLFGEGDG